MERVKYVSFFLILFFLFRCWLIYGVAQVSEYITPLLTRQVHIERCVFPKDGLSPKKQNQAHTRFLSSALVKRNLLASFTDILLLSPSSPTPSRWARRSLVGPGHRDVESAKVSLVWVEWERERVAGFRES